MAKALKKNCWSGLMCVGLITACGGGGGSGGSDSPAPAPEPDPPAAALTFQSAIADSGIDYGTGYFDPPEGMPAEFAGGAAAGDYDNDGDIDVFIVRGDIGPNLLYTNIGNNIFVNDAAVAGVDYTKGPNENYRHSGPAFADMDGDNDLDLFIGGIYGDPNFIFRNNGDATFTDVTAGSGIDTMQAGFTVSAAFGDYDLDGDLDMALAHWGVEYDSHTDPGDTEHLWRNDSDAGQIKFTSVSEAASISATAISPAAPNGVLDGTYDYSFSPSFADFNNDRYPDLLMVNDFGTTLVYENNRDSTFTDRTGDSDIRVVSGMGSAVADYDNDGDLDWFATAIYDEEFLNPDHGNRLYRNNGSGVFSDVTDAAGVIDGGWGWGACFADFNNDGRLDIYHTNGWKQSRQQRYEQDPSRLFLANADGTFTESAAGAGIFEVKQGRGVVCADFDNDGDTDILLLHNNVFLGAELWRNDLTGANHLRVKLNGKPPNTEAVGARIYIDIGTDTQMREINKGNNFTSENPTLQMFGLGSHGKVDAVRIVWPDGRVETHENVAANQLLVYEQPN